MARRRKERGEPKCEGRFAELRTDIAKTVEEAFIRDDPHYRFIKSEDLADLATLLDSSAMYTRDQNDPYFFSRVDTLRKDPIEIFGVDGSTSDVNYEAYGLSIIPLIAPDTEGGSVPPISDGLRDSYVRKFVDSESIVEKLRLFGGDRNYDNEGVERLDIELGIDTAKINIPTRSGGHASLSGYKLSAGFGLGYNKLRTLVYDAPYHVELHRLDPKERRRAVRTKESGVMGVGFWLNPNNELLLAQIQEMRGSDLPEGVELGIVGYRIAEAVARGLGLSTVKSYSARTHPQFLMHPDSRRQLGHAFKCDFDKSASKLDYEPIIRKDGGNDINIGFVKQL